MTPKQFNRRDSLKSLAALGAAGTLGAFSELAFAQQPITVGVIYVGPRDDYGYNQAQAEAAAMLKKMPGVKVVEEENVPETAAVQKTMTGMIAQDGASLVFPTSFGYFDPHMLAVAAKFPDARFAHCGGMWTEGKHPKNTASFFGYIDECQYLNGVVAAHMSKSGKLGFIAAKPIPQVLRNINAFTMGARSIKPGITTQVIFTGDWSMPVKEAEAEWNWLTAYKTFLDAARDGKPHPNFVRGGLKDGFVKMSAYGPTVTDAAKKAADGIKAQMMAGKFDIFKGGLKDNKGAAVIPAGKAYKQTDLDLEKMNYLVEGVIGSAS